MLREKQIATEKLAVLPLFLRPKTISELVRLGRDNDGGYLVDKRSITASEIMLGFGIKDDWSFEKDFQKCSDVPVVAFDASIGRLFFFRRLVKSVARANRDNFVHWFRIFSDYYSFFRGRNAHIKKFVGMKKKSNYISVNTIAKKFIPSNVKNVFFKIDIEGSEYQVLDDLITISDRVCGLVIEFHSVDLNMEKIASFVRKFPLKICHVHCNNCAPMNELSTPLVIEVTFTRFDVEDGYVENLPNSIDLPNNSGAEDYLVTFL